MLGEISAFVTNRPFMNSSDKSAAPRASGIARLLSCLWTAVCGFGWSLVILWASLALFYNARWTWLGIVLGLAFASFGAWTLWLSRKPRLRWVFAGALVLVFAWFASLSPSQDRNWRPEVAVLPRAYIDGDNVRITGVRNFEYRSRHDFTVRYEEREVQISHLTSLDFFLSYWKVGPVGHTFVSFNFDNAPPLCVSIETRPEVGEGFAPIASLFKQFELIYVVGDEHDLVGSRVMYRPEETLLYRVRASPEMVQRLFRVYLQRINELAERPEWYHLLSNSCTINIVRYANKAGREGGFHFGHLLNGYSDRYLYDSGVVDTSLGFEELRRRSWITDAVRAAYDSPDFSERIREGRPGIAPQSAAAAEK